MNILRVNFNIGYVSQMSDLPILSSSLNLRNLFAIHPLLSYVSGDQLFRINALPQVTSLIGIASNLKAESNSSGLDRLAGSRFSSRLCLRHGVALSNSLTAVPARPTDGRGGRRWFGWVSRSRMNPLHVQLQFLWLAKLLPAESAERPRAPRV